MFDNIECTFDENNSLLFTIKNNKQEVLTSEIIKLLSKIKMDTC